MKPIGLSIADTRKTLGGIGRTTIYRMISREELEAIKVGGRTLITLESIERLVANARRLEGCA